MTEAAAIEARGLRKAFGPRVVLDEVSLRARRGSVVALLGASGAGKSTLLRCLNLLEIPDSGEILVGGEAVRLARDRRGRRRAADRSQADRVRTRVGMVFQQFNLWPHMTALQNVAEAPVRVLKRRKREAAAAAARLLEEVGLAGRGGDYPAQLSGGQQQRVAIARALAMEPEVLLFDEPTSALDPERVGEVLRVMRQLAREGRTMIVATHEMGFAREACDEVVFLRDGAVAARGPAGDLFDDPRPGSFRQFLAGGPAAA